MYENEDFDFEDMDVEESPILEDLMERLRSLPERMILILNMPKYERALRAIETISGFVLDVSPDAKITADFDKLTGTSLCLTIIADELSINKMQPFCAALHFTDTMSVVPLTDGNIEIGFTFEDIRLPAPPPKK